MKRRRSPCLLAGSMLPGTVAALCVVAGLALGAPEPASDEPDDSAAVPTATLTFRGKTASAGVGFAWSESTLEFEGQRYPVRADGFVAGAVGVASFEGIGRVYGLKNVEDLNGSYTSLGAAGTAGSGGGRFAMRNDKGVRIVIELTSSGLQLGVGPRGVTLTVGEPGAAPVGAAPALPKTLGFGEARFGGLYLRPTLNGQAFFAASRNPGFDGEFSFGPVDEADEWLETSSELGLNARYLLGDEGRFGTLQTRVSGVYSRTGSGPDGPVCLGSSNSESETTLESAYLAWQSGPLFPGLGENAVELSGGSQNYQVFDGLLFWDGGQDCAGRGANWLSPRKAFHNTGIATLSVGKFVFEAAHLKFNDVKPDTDTQLGLGRFEYVTDDGPMEHLKIGLLFFNIYDSDTESRDGMKGYYVHNEATPFRSVPDLTYKASFIAETNSRSSGLTTAYGWYFNPAYEFSDAAWKPKIGYRYATFTGGGTQNFDPLFAGLPEWGTWFQGELLGEYVLSNSNLISHQLRLTLRPSEPLTVNLIYYKFLLDDEDAQGFGAGTVDSRRLADEIDLIFDLTPTGWWSITATVSVAFPSSGFRQAVGGDAKWVNGYLYMNFNF